MLRKAAAQTMQDADFRNDAKKLEIDIAPMSAGETTAMVNRLFDTPSAVVARMKAAFSP